ncbi:radical SAM protein [Clostridium butanoliproducens]|uniref:B12-binding domain-containing radical SAM protein n=1 Tax=Clostridium butanoliproducens TaxID=2991837 RepID=UPI002DD630A5|nr:radical SAM protein [Clostridium butanoliproducens]
MDRSSIIGGDPDEVIKDVIALKEKYNTNYFYFLNNAFNFSPKFVDSFCKKIIDINLEIHWSDCGRFNNLTYERLELMKKAGCVKLTFGFESGSLKIIELIDKRINLDHAERVLKWCYELGIWVDIEVIVGLPQEYDEDFNATCEFINKNKKYINYFWINEFFVVPNSLIGRYPEKYGIELIKDINNYRKLLDNNLKMFKRESDNVMTSNSKLFGFNEINRRNFDAIVSDNRKKISKLSNMQNSEFNEAAKFYTMLCEIK